MLNKKISRDEKIAKLSLEATLLYTWCIPYLDFRGRIYADSYNLKSIVPFIEEITLKKIHKIIQEWVSVDLVIYYGDDTHKYLEFKGFFKNQTLREGRESESEMPPPTPAELQRNSSGTPAQVKSKLNLNLSKGNSEVEDVFILPKNIDIKVWNAFKEMRQKNRKSLTHYACQLIIDELKKFKSDPNDILKQSIKNSWQGVFELKENNKSKKRTIKEEMEITRKAVAADEENRRKYGL